jgi:hypothetical protein
MEPTVSDPVVMEKVPGMDAAAAEFVPAAEPVSYAN